MVSENSFRAYLMKKQLQKIKKLQCKLLGRNQPRPNQKNDDTLEGLASASLDQANDIYEIFSTRTTSPNK